MSGTTHCRYDARFYDASQMIENLLSTIYGLLAAGFVSGMLIGLYVNKHKLGCLVLLAVPFSMIVYVSWWQGQHPENLRSTSGLDFLFGPLWPSLGATVGFYVGLGLRRLVQKS
jgi:hypothetical protein